MTSDRTPEELTAWLRLAAEPGLGRATARQLLAQMGLPQHIFASSVSTLGRLVPHDMAARLARPPEAEVQATIAAGSALLQLPNHHLLTLADPEYPPSLLDIPDPPILLFVQGNVGMLHRPGVAVVGARNATEGGKDNARAFSRHLAERGWAIISGLARGIDAAAHEGALMAGPKGGGTVAVLAGGLDLVYPRQHIELARRIAASGCGAVVSEYLPGTPAIPFRFPDRNRLVAGLSRGVLVVEAAAQSGSLLTARLGLESGREVFAIPGSIHAPLSRGCHALIRQGAKLVEQGRDIEEELQRTGPTPPADTIVSSMPNHDTSPGKHAGMSRHSDGEAGEPGRSSRRAAFANQASGRGAMAADRSPARRPSGRMLKDPIINRVLSALGYDPASVDVLCQRCGLDVSRIGAALTELELNDVVQRLDDGRYQRRQHSIIEE